jgi:hypothetical protein
MTDRPCPHDRERSVSGPHVHSLRKTPMDAISETGTTKRDRTPVGRLILGLDGWLRRRQALIEYSSDRRCVFRIQIGRLERDVALADGTRGRTGDRVVDLHIWNEHVPIMPKEGATIVWARLALDHLDTSLRELARYLAARRDLDDILIIRGNAACGVPEQRAQVTRMCERYGFEKIADPAAPTMRQRAHRLGENILISLIVWTLNTTALRRDTLRRDRVQVFMSRAVLARRFGGQRAG